MSRTRAMHDRPSEPDDLEDRPTRPIEPDTLLDEDGAQRRTTTIELGIDRSAMSLASHPRARSTHRTATIELGIERSASPAADDLRATAPRTTKRTATIELGIERETAPLVPGDLAPRGAGRPAPRKPLAEPRVAGRAAGQRGAIDDLEIAYARIRALEHEVRRDELGRAQTRILSLQRKVIRARAHARTATTAAPVIALTGFALTLAGGSILIADDPSPHMTGGIIACLGTLLAFAAGYAMFATPAKP